MALKGTIKGKVTQNSNIYSYYMQWSAVQNINDNYSDVTVWHYWTRSSTSLNFDTTVERRYGVTIDGATTSGNKHFDFNPWPSDTTISKVTKRIYHNSDGTKSIKISTYANGRAASYGPSSSSESSGDCTASATITLDTIPRASSVTCNSFYIGDSTTINIDRASANFTHTLKYTYGDLTGVIADKTTLTSVGWTPDKSLFYSRIPNGRTGYGSVTCETYNGTTLTGTKTTNFNAYAKENECLPTVSGTIVDTNEKTIALTGDSTKLIKYLSIPKVTVAATPKYSSSIKSRKILWGDGQLSTNAEQTFSNGVTSYFVNVSATDSRDYTTPVVYDLNALNRWVEYIKLAFSKISLTRTESTLSTANLKVSGNYFNGSFGSVANDFTLKYRYKPNESGSTFTDFKVINGKDIPKTTDTFEYTETVQDIDFNKEYIFEFVLEDKAMMVQSGEKKLESGQAIFRIGKDYIKTNGRILDKTGTEIPNGLSIYRTGGVDIDPNITLEELILTETNTPSGGFWYVRTMFYSTRTKEANRTQIAYPYSYSADVKACSYMRTYVAGIGWSEWALVGARCETGIVTITPSAANTPTSVYVAFKNTYNKVPNVVVSAATGAIGTQVTGASTNGISKTGVNIVLTRTNTTATTIHFIVQEEV